MNYVMKLWYRHQENVCPKTRQRSFISYFISFIRPSDNESSFNCIKQIAII